MAVLLQISEPGQSPEPHQRKRAVGIDLGTTNSLVATVRSGSAVILNDEQGRALLPSALHYDRHGLSCVGYEALGHDLTAPLNTLTSVKRFMGRGLADVALFGEQLPYEFVEQPGGGMPKFATAAGAISPVQASAELLASLERRAELALGGDLDGAVITVPAYFDDAQRQATKDAAMLAGLKVLRLLNEPTAAAIAYGLDAGGEGTIAVYDLGGGTFDISIIEIAEVDGEHQFEVLATNGDTFLGGEDFDLRLIEYLAAEFKKENGIDLHNDPLALQRLKEAGEKAKIELSSSQQTEVNLPYITADATGPKHLVVKLSRSKLESLVEDLVKRSLEPVKVALKDAGLSPSEINDVILVGGQTRMPLVQKAVTDFFGKEPRRDVNPDEAVAVGASIQGAVLSGDVKDVLLLDVTPLTLGIETMGGVATPLIEKNTTIPTKKSQVFSTADDNQTAVTIHVVQGERKQAAQNKSLGRFDLADIPPAPRGMPQIEVTFDLDANGILNVSAKDKATGKEQSIRITASSGLSDDEIEAMVRDAEANAEADAKFEALIAARNSCEGMVHAAKNTLQEAAEHATDEEKSAIEAAIAEAEEALKGDDKDAIEAAATKVTEATSPVAQKMYQAQAAAGEQAQGADAQEAAADDAVDAEFEEVKDDKK